MKASPAIESRGQVVRVRSDLVLLLVGTVTLVLSSLAVDAHHVSGVETAVFRVVNDLPGAIYKPLWVFMQLGNLFVIPAAALVALLARRWRFAGGLFLGGLATYVLAKVVKRIVTRGRPFTLLTGVHIHGAAGRGLGYVSGHAGVVAALITVAWPWLSTRARWAVVVLGMGVWLGRMYVGAHLPLDILGGAALGVAVGAATRLLLGRPAQEGSDVRSAPV
jgi:undecaprenyl-diphosphatase